MLAPAQADADVGLELGELYAETGRWKDLERLAAESVALVAHRPQLVQLYEALRQWRTTAVDARERIAEVVASCRALRAGQLERPGAVEIVDGATLRRRLLGLLQGVLAGCRSLEELGERLLAEVVAVHCRAARGGVRRGSRSSLKDGASPGTSWGTLYRLSSLRRRLGG